MTEQIDISYRRARIVAGDPGSGPMAVVHVDGARVCRTEAPTLTEAVDQARAWIDQLLDGQRAARRLAHVGTREEYLRVFRALALDPPKRAMLRAHANAPDRRLGTQATNGTTNGTTNGATDPGAVPAHYGALGRQVAELLEIEPPIDPGHAEPDWVRLLADGDGPGNGHGPAWTLHPEVADALRRLDMA